MIQQALVEKGIKEFYVLTVQEIIVELETFDEPNVLIQFGILLESY